MTSDLPAIHKKWPHIRLYGPAIELDRALEIILRTDRSLARLEWMCNDRGFENSLRAMIGYDQNRDDRWDIIEAYKANYRHVELQYLASHWVADTYIFGAHGPIKPTGEVRYAYTFGKWPSVEEIEADLATFAEAFLDLEFQLFLWDTDEGPDIAARMPPTHGWYVRAGLIGRHVNPASAIDWTQVPKGPNFETGYLTRSETTWTVSQIESMWGYQLKSAMADAKAFMAQQGRMEQRRKAEARVKELRHRSTNAAARAALRAARTTLVKSWGFDEAPEPHDLTIEQADLLLNMSDALRKLGDDVEENIYDDYVTTVMGDRGS